MNRRNFITSLIAIIGVGVLGTIIFNYALLRKIFFKLLVRIKPPTKQKTESELDVALLPAEGSSISVETALNSRCTSDYDDIQWLYHWGMFDKEKRLTEEMIQEIISKATIPRYTDADATITAEHSMLTFSVDASSTSCSREWVMVESGMQQQAIGLVCAALGVGYVFRTIGIDGRKLSENSFETVRIKLDPMKPSYNGTYWSTATPAKTQAWEKGTLSDPRRTGGLSLLSIMNNLQTSKTNGKEASREDLSQLLWAARGRTPHYYKSDPWGMTIPTYQGNNNISEIIVVSGMNAQKYINWQGNRPTHSLVTIGLVGHEEIRALKKNYEPFKSLIILQKKENTGRALWEIGYQMMNLIVQARSLHIRYTSKLLDENTKKGCAIGGINDPVAIFAI